MHEEFMRMAVELAVDNVRSGSGGPFAALIVRDGRIVADGTNRVTSSNDPTAHAEINAIRAACDVLGRYHLPECDIYTTCEPCPMCLGAIYWARLGRVFFAATREDAREAGFDDEDIYDEIARPPAARRVEMVRTLPEAASRAFKAWLTKSDRVPY